jgi:hypothetical protein
MQFSHLDFPSRIKTRRERIQDALTRPQSRRLKEGAIRTLDKWMTGGVGRGGWTRIASRGQRCRAFDFSLDQRSSALICG